MNLAYAERIYVELPNGDGVWCNKTERWYEYDSKGNKVHYKSTMGHDEWWTYDSKNNVIEYNSTFLGSSTTLYAYNKKGLLYKEKHISKYGESEKYYEYDDNGNLIHYKTSYQGDEYYAKYDEKGRLILKEDPYGNVLFELIEEYDKNGNLTNYKDEDIEICYEYDENNKLIYKKEVDINENYTTEEWYDNAGVLKHQKTIRDSVLSSWYEENWYENGKIVHYKDKNTELWFEYSNNYKNIHTKGNDGFQAWETYDDKLNLLTYKDTSGYNKSCKYKYDSNGNEIYMEQTSYYNDNPNDIDLYIIKYDSEGREIYTKDKSHIGEFETWIEYDSFGNKIHYKDCDVNENDIYEEWYKYNENNQLIFYQDIYGSRKEFDSDGHLLYELEIKPDE